MTTESSLQETTTETVKFAIVGVSGIGVNFITIWIAINLHANDELAIALGIFFSMTTNYLLNRLWTFQSDREKRMEYPKYIASNLLGIALQYFIALGLEDYFEQQGYDSLDLVVITVPSIYFASLAGILVGFVANFALSKYFVFK